MSMEILDRRRTTWPMSASIPFAIFLIACADPPPAELTPEAEAPSTGAARWEPVRRPTDAALLEHPAHVVADPAASGEVGPPFRARVVRVSVRVGQRVEAGDPIVEVVMPEVLDAAASVDGASARIAAHRGRAEELERLRSEGIVDASRAFEQRAMVAELEATRARALAVLRAASVSQGEARGLLRRGTSVLTAPSAGIVRSLDAVPGETREPGAAPFARIVGEGDVRIEVRSTAPLATHESAAFEGSDGTHLALAREPIAHIVDPADGTHVTWLAPVAQVALPDGLRGRVVLASADAWEVPATALVIAGDGASIRRRAANGVESVRVDVLASSGATAVVRGALREDDLVASDPSALEPSEAP